MAKVRIIAQDAKVSMTATLKDTPTVKDLLKVLPVEAEAQTWGEEVYFEVPVHRGEEDSHSTVPSGTVAYWPPGHSFCVFYGQTPFSPVNVLGTLDDDPNYFGRVRSGDRIRVERVAE